MTVLVLMVLIHPTPLLLIQNWKDWYLKPQFSQYLEIKKPRTGIRCPETEMIVSPASKRILNGISTDISLRSTC